MRHEAIEKAARALVEVLDNDESLGSWTYGHFRVALDDALALPATPAPEDELNRAHGLDFAQALTIHAVVKGAIGHLRNGMPGPALRDLEGLETRPSVTPTPEAAARDEARAEVARLRGMMREAEEVLRGHMIGINCKGPRMDDDLAKRWRTALALHIAADSPPHDAAKVGGDE